MWEQRNSEAAADQFADGSELGDLERDVWREPGFTAPGLGQLPEVVIGRVGDEGLVHEICESKVSHRRESMILGHRDLDVLGTDADVSESFGCGDDQGQIEVSRDQVGTECRAVRLLEEHPDPGMAVPEFCE